MTAREKAIEAAKLAYDAQDHANHEDFLKTMLVGGRPDPVEAAGPGESDRA